MSLLPQRKKSAEELANLRESLGIPGELPSEKAPQQPSSSDPAPAIPAPFSLIPAKPPKPVSSLRKSEFVPLPVSTPAPRPADSKLPSYRRSDGEIEELRRQDAIDATVVLPQTQIAHPVLIAPGYLAAIAGAISFHFYQLEIRITAACVGIALLFAIWIFFKKTYSRHHAAFIAMMALFVIVFGTLHYFPQLRHGT